MPTSASKTKTVSPASVALAEHFADREGLVGTAREQFLKFIDDSLDFHRPARPGKWQTLVIGSTVAGLMGVVLDVSTAGATFTERLLMWGGCSLAGVILALVLRRAERLGTPVDREIHWRVYCLVLRPVMLVEQPGLLDRNLPADRSAHDRVPPSSLWSLGSMLRERGADFWWSCAIGLWVGMLGLIICHKVSATRLAGWEFLLPVLGTLLGPAAWALLQCVAYWLARRHTRFLRG